VPFLLFIPLPIPAWIVLGLWFVLQWADSLGHSVAGGGVAYPAHIVGFLAGMLVGLAVRLAGSGQATPRHVRPS
jgi:membrane associated rhomboid family serine protease